MTTREAVRFGPPDFYRNILELIVTTGERVDPDRHCRTKFSVHVGFGDRGKIQEYLDLGCSMGLTIRYERWRRGFLSEDGEFIVEGKWQHVRSYLKCFLDWVE